ncbi:MAG: SGNH/GDSL hydrolase family protein [Gemmatimonadota bacterium]
MAHIVLLGDSIFDNQPYVAQGGATIDELSARLPAGWQATLLAHDGDRARDVRSQLRGVPASATHLVVSVGGNDALDQQALMAERVRTVDEALRRLGEVAQKFEDDYRVMLRTVLAKALPVTICTIYNGNFDDWETALVFRTALAAFNDVIIRAGWENHLPILDLRAVCDRPAHYANPIEPSTEGSARIAEAIVRMMS